MENIQLEINERKTKVNSAVAKAPTSFLQRILRERKSFDLDIVISAHFELERRKVQ